MNSEFLCYELTLPLLLIMSYFCSVNASECGKQAILQLAGGDLRRVLNLLQVHIQFNMRLGLSILSCYIVLI